MMYSTSSTINNLILILICRMSYGCCFSLNDFFNIYFYSFSSQFFLCVLATTKTYHLLFHFKQKEKRKTNQSLLFTWKNVNFSQLTQLFLFVWFESVHQLSRFISIPRHCLHSYQIHFDQD